MVFSPLENDLWPCVIFFNPRLLNVFSKGKNSPNGTSLILSYLNRTSNLLLIITKLLKTWSLAFLSEPVLMPNKIKWFSENASTNIALYFCLYRRLLNYILNQN